MHSTLCHYWGHNKVTEPLITSSSRWLIIKKGLCMNSEFQLSSKASCPCSRNISFDSSFQKLIMLNPHVLCRTSLPRQIKAMKFHKHCRVLNIWMANAQILPSIYSGLELLLTSGVHTKTLFPKLHRWCLNVWIYYHIWHILFIA